ncbi:MAG TPA: hypothetical protein VFH51_03910, partial [Myxococcota bacterium]|nr:hypothetical protein [Myxococcota bacterium]
YGRAARALAAAAALPDAPPFVGPLAARMAATAGEPEAGLQMVESLMQGMRDPALLETYGERRRLLLLEVHLKHLQRAVDRYREAHGAPPATLAALVGAGLLRAVPEDPLGGTYGLDAAGHVTTVHEAQRLRLRPEVRQPTHASD